MAHLSRRLVVTAVTAALFVALGLVAPADRTGWVGPEPAAAAALPQPGKRGKAVRALQKRLVDASYLRAQYRTGYYGSRTKKAVKALQRRYDLKATGRMTKATDRALTKAVAAMTKPRTWYHSAVIGRSQSGRKITAYRAGEPGKPVVVVIATMHGEEDFGQDVVRAAAGPPDQGHRPVGAAGGEPGRVGPRQALGERTRGPQPQLPVRVGEAGQQWPPVGLRARDEGDHGFPHPDPAALPGQLAPAPARRGHRQGEGPGSVEATGQEPPAAVEGTRLWRRVPRDHDRLVQPHVRRGRGHRRVRFLRPNDPAG